MSGRSRPEWDLPVQVVQARDVDERLITGVGRTGLLQTLIDHDTPHGARCARCGCRATVARPNCPSRVIAKALIERRPFPAWLAHLADSVPGAWRTPGTAAAREQQRADEDELPGLFAAPRRVPDPGRPR